MLGTLGATIMSEYQNQFGQPIGPPMTDWVPCSHPAQTTMAGQYCHVVPLDCKTHGDDIFRAFRENADDRSWTYLPYGPFESRDVFLTWLRKECAQDDPLFYAIVDSLADAAVGMASYLRIAPEVGTIEVGHIHFSPRLQRKPAATEAMFLMMSHAFDDLGYRRYEWKCDALNEPSRNAALRLGFTFEGVFRQATVYKNRSRDSAWFSITDSEWPDIRAAITQWLSPSNFDGAGWQRVRLSELTGEIRKKRL